MIPPINFLRRPSLKSGCTNAQYNPYTLIFRGPDAPKIVDGKIEDWNYVAQMQGTYSHEFTHWNDYHGTTTGAFLSFLRYSQQLTVTNLLTRLPRSTRDVVIKQRRNEIPIIPIDDKGMLYETSSDYELNVFKQIWYDHHLVHAIIDCSTQQEEISWPKGEVFSEVASDVVLFACEQYGFGVYPGHEEVRQWYRFDEEFYPLISFWKRRLTSRSLFEGSATANEILIIARWLSDSKLGAMLSDFLTPRIREILEGDYGVALNAFLAATNRDAQDASTVLSTFSTVCDLALNPPLPPLVMTPPPDGVWRWRDIYPPMRFMRIISSLEKFGFLPPDSEANVVREYVEKLCDYHKWPSPWSFQHPYQQKPNRIDFLNISSTDFPSSITYHDYVLWVQSKMWQTRQTLPQMFTCFADCIMGELSRKYVGLAFKGDVERWSQPVLQWTPENTIGYTGAGSEIGDWLLLSSAGHYAMFDFMCGVGNLDFSDYPQDIRNEDSFTRPIMTGLARAIGFEPSDIF